jgi:Protein of unknown function (DUF3644)/EC042_2821-lke REase
VVCRMIPINEKLISNSLAAALSSIEIYNKPDFKYREEIFTILIINAWELLLKAKILRDADDNVESLYIPLAQGGYKLSRNGTPLTIEINGAMNKVGLAQTVADNIKVMVEIRDSAVHFYHDSSLNYLLYTLGVASLQNYQKLMNIWFSKSLLDYNFYILPLGFTYNFKSLSSLELSKEPEAISNLIKYVTNMLSSTVLPNDFYFICEVTAQIKRVAKYTSMDADLSVAIDPSAQNGIIIDRVVPLIDQYPFSYTQLQERVKKERPETKNIYEIIRKYSIKNNSTMSAYNFRTKAQKEKYDKTGVLPRGITSIYNENAVRFIVATLPIS